MFKKLVFSALAMVLLTGMLTTAASAKNIDCTGKGGTLNCPKDLPRVGSGRYAKKFLLAGTPQADTIRGTKSKDGDFLEGGAGNDRLIGERGNDVLAGGPGNDRLDGSGDSDRLIGGPGNDTLAADSGRDSLEGGPGNDRYVVPRSDHVINDSAGTDTLFIGKAVSKSRIEQRGKDLVIDHAVGQVTIKNHFGRGRIEAINFANGDRLRFSPTNVTLSGPSVAKVLGDGKGGENNREREERIEREIGGGDGEVIFDVSIFCCGDDERFSFGVTVFGERFDVVETFRAIIDWIRDVFAEKGRNGGGGGLNGGGSDQNGRDFEDNEAENRARAGEQSDNQLEENERQFD